MFILQWFSKKTKVMLFCSFLNLCDIESIRVKEENVQKGDNKQKEVTLRKSKYLF